MNGNNSGKNFDDIHDNKKVSQFSFDINFVVGDSWGLIKLTLILVASLDVSSRGTTCTQKYGECIRNEKLHNS